MISSTKQSWPRTNLLLRVEVGHSLRDKVAPVATMDNETLMAQAFQQLGEDASGGNVVEALLVSGLAPAIAGNRWCDHLERQAIAVGFGEQRERLVVLEHRARPAVNHQQGHHHLGGLRWAHADEVDVESFDLRQELWVSVQLRLLLAPVVLRAPVVDNLAQFGAWEAIVELTILERCHVTRLGQSLLEVHQGLVANVDLEGADTGVIGRILLAGCSQSKSNKNSRLSVRVYLDDDLVTELTFKYFASKVAIGSVRRCVRLLAMTTPAGEVDAHAHNAEQGDGPDQLTHGIDR